MSTRVVCISRTVAAGGERVGRLVAERLGFRYLDDEVIALASERAGLDPATVAKAEGHSGLLTRLVEALTAPLRAAESHFLTSEDRARDVGETHSSFTPPPDELRRLIHDAILEIARCGSAVIVAHAASTALANQKGVLRVFVTASPSTRTNRLYLGVVC